MIQTMNIETGPATESSIAKPADESGGLRVPEKSVRRLFVAARDSMARLSTTRANGQAGLVADVSTSIVLLGAGLWHTDIAPMAALVTILFGLLIFSFVEYFFHRWLFHGATQVMEQGHRKHHEQPLGYDALPFFLPPLGLLMLTGTLALFVPASYACLLLGALAAGYAAYGLSHAAIHNTRFRNSVSRRWAAAHHIHHCHPEKNFGVTTPLWDIVLGTRYVSTGKGLKPREMVVGTTDQ
jgi:sterol desaturase/sphingolipid hydroxylase (fatty acid hydroxylase superfamily)